VHTRIKQVSEQGVKSASRDDVSRRPVPLIGALISLECTSRLSSMFAIALSAALTRTLWLTFAGSSKSERLALESSLSDV
jgi:hypothetical protein